MRKIASFLIEEILKQKQAALIVYVLFAIFGYLFTVSPFSTTVLNTFGTQIKFNLI